MLKRIWPETEVNLTHYYQGSNSGNTSAYLTPASCSAGFVCGIGSASPPGGGFEIAVTRFHPTRHIPILSIRFLF